MSPLTETVLFVFDLVALGYVAALSGYLKAGSGEVLAQFAVGIAMPVLLFRTMAKVDFHGAAPWSLWGAYFSTIAIAWTVGHLVTTRLFGRDARAGVVGGVSSSFSNLVLLGIPFMSGIFGQHGVDILSLLVSVHLPVMMMASVILFESFSRVEGQPMDVVKVLRAFLRKVFVNPLIIGILAGLVWRMTGLELPGLGTRLVDVLANIAGPVALFAMGAELSGFGISGNLRAALSLSVAKLMLMPAVVLLFALAFGLPPLTAKVAVVAASMPAGVNSYLIATQFGTGQALASSQMTLSTVLAAFTTGIWLMIATSVFG
ncbi:transporter [Mesorhizobium sp. Root552]|uniref:AEC family transporter n=1 Tax=Mesorhizobium sp. Root552 TaxID=1736555 RepID=UPI0006F9A4E4|nr:AEC family transporter [Mesorhizobium sp. Root552]KQZ16779.1 transporter [Mesorhizobium sp. Root552]